MDLLKQIFPNEPGDLRKWSKYIKFIVRERDNFITTTYQIKPSKKGTDDQVYANNPKLQQIIPRGFSVVQAKDSLEIVNIVMGTRKFSGKDTLDEDLDDNDKPPTTNIYNHGKTLEWMKGGKLKIIRTEKAIGKLALCKLGMCGGRRIITAGSKNVHLTGYWDKIGLLLSDDNSIIVNSILEDILSNKTEIESLMSKFMEGYTLVGELCDGQHFTPGDNTIQWFGLFKNGSCLMDYSLTSHGIKTVDSEVVYDNGIENSLDKVFSMSKCVNGEGSVMYVMNKESGETVLVKSKSVSYIVKRFARQKIMNGYINIHKIKDRFIDAVDYHSLNTLAAIRITRQLFNFAMWMMKNNYPCTVLGCTEVISVRGTLPNGFNIWWTKWMDETGSNDIEVTPEDFDGEFNITEYISSPELELYEKRLLVNAPRVVFFQGIQGSGKSTLGNYWATREGCVQIEQDMVWGCTKSAQGQLYHYIRDNSMPNTVLITRCNANPKHYARYLDIAMGYGCAVYFVAPEMVDDLYLMSSLAGICNRSEHGDKLMVGRSEYDIRDAFKFTKDNYDGFKPLLNAVRYGVVKSNTKMLKNAKNVVSVGLDNMITFVKDNTTSLMDLRVPVDEQYNSILSNILDSQVVELNVKNTTYIGFFIRDQTKLFTCVSDVSGSETRSVCEHVTQIYFGKKTYKQKFGYGINGDIYNIYISAYVIEKATGATAFRVNRVVDMKGNDMDILTRKPHITAVVPYGCNSKDSINYVFKSDDSVTVYNIDIMVDALCKWM
jgi:hypothetical protein